MLYARPDLSPPRFLPTWFPTGAHHHVAKVALGWSGCELTDAGAVRCWGFSMNAGQLAGRREVPIAAPVTIALPVRAVDVAVGRDHTCALVATGAVYCWGWDVLAFERGHGTTEVIAVPREVPALRGAKAIALGEAHICAITADDRVVCGGWNRDGQIGSGPVR